MIEKLHRLLAYLCFLGALCAAILATVSYIQGFFDAFLINTLSFLGCSGLGFINLRLARRCFSEFDIS